MVNQQAKIKDIFQIGIDAWEKIINSIRSIEVDNNELVYQHIVMFFLSKAYKSYQAIYLLCREKFGEDAVVLCRTLFELSLQARYLMKNPVKHGKLWLDYDMIHRYNFYLQLSKIDPTHSAVQTDTPKKRASLNELKEHYENNKDKYGRRGINWYGKSIRDLAKEIDGNNPDKPMEKWYVTMYSIESGYVHSGTTITDDYLKFEPDCLRVGCYPDSEVDPDVAVKATLYFIQTITCVAQAFELDSKIMDEAFQQYQKLVRYLSRCRRSRSIGAHRD